MPRFVILSHDWPEPHLDLLLERGGVLKAWRLPANFDPAGEATAVHNFDHRLHYLDFEGEIGGDRGRVTRWDAGELEWLTAAEGVFTVRMHGATVRGVFVMRRMNAKEWRLVASPAGQVPPGEGDLSVLEREGL
jgi:hypothetical protein